MGQPIAKKDSLMRDLLCQVAYYSLLIHTRNVLQKYFVMQ